MGSNGSSGCYLLTGTLDEQMPRTPPEAEPEAHTPGDDLVLSPAVEGALERWAAQYVEDWCREPDDFVSADHREAAQFLEAHGRAAWIPEPVLLAYLDAITTYGRLERAQAEACNAMESDDGDEADLRAWQAARSNTLDAREIWRATWSAAYDAIPIELWEKYAARDAATGYFECGAYAVRPTALEPWVDDDLPSGGLLPEYLELRLGLQSRVAGGVPDRIVRREEFFVLSGVARDAALLVMSELDALGCAAEVIDEASGLSTGDRPEQIVQSARPDTPTLDAANDDDRESLYNRDAGWFIEEHGRASWIPASLLEAYVDATITFAESQRATDQARRLFEKTARESKGRTKRTTTRPTWPPRTLMTTRLSRALRRH